MHEDRGSASSDCSHLLQQRGALSLRRFELLSQRLRGHKRTSATGVRCATNDARSTTQTHACVNAGMQSAPHECVQELMCAAPPTMPARPHRPMHA
eukprot:361601-Chlamydomonas_euryale.AAC.1